MTEDNNKQRPVRKLTVDNFSVIKHAELEFGKITVLIGPQASGKSLLCKLAYFFDSVGTELAGEFSGSKRSWQDFLDAVRDNFAIRFPVSGWGSTSFAVGYLRGGYRVELKGHAGRESHDLSVTFSPEFQQQYLENRDWGPQGLSDDKLVNELIRRFRWYNSFFKANQLLGNERLEVVRYIPAGRSFFANLNKVFALLQNENLDPILREFAGHLDWGSTIEATRLTPAVFERVRKTIERIQGGKITVAGASPMFITADGRELPLKMLSSGIQELVPLLMFLTSLAAQSVVDRSTGERTRDHSLFVEEPEAHIFPSTQYELIQLFTWLANEPALSFNWVITTHSPYILTAFNNRIEAAQVAAAKPDLKSEIARLIPEEYWIKPNDFRAYAIENGVLTSIVAEDTGLVSANYLDQVSETIGAEFDELLRLGYVES
jgi:AAA ATPase domain